MASETSYLVTLPTGRQGASTAAELLKHGKIVHALVSDKTSDRAKSLENIGCILLEGTLDETPTIEPAMKGVTGVFLNLRPLPQDAEAEVPQTRNLLDVAASAKTVT